jgi:hypothetical protein
MKKVDKSDARCIVILAFTKPDFPKGVAMSSVLCFCRKIWNVIKPDPKFWEDLDEWSRKNGYW